jgi:two-component system chemotaxis response regulator CheY
MRTIVTKILLDLKFDSSKIEEAVDGRMAADKLKNTKFDLIISDWHMPNMTGIELLKVIRSVPGLKTIPFLMATAEGQKENILEAVQGGVNNYIVKPFKPAQMANKLKLMFQRN